MNNLQVVGVENPHANDDTVDVNVQIWLTGLTRIYAGLAAATAM